MVRTITLLVSGVLVGCGGPGYLDGVGFEVRDAIYETAPGSETNRTITTVVISDAVDLCDRDSLAGHSVLVVRSWETGGSAVQLTSYDDDCTVLTDERAHQTWVDLETAGHGAVDLDVAFRTKARSASGRISANWCGAEGGLGAGCR